MGGSDEERTCAQIKQGDVTLSSKSQYVYHSRIPTFSTDYSSRQEIKKKNILFEVDSSSKSFLSHFSTTRLSDNRSICFLLMSSPTSIYNLSSRSLQSVDRCNDTKLEHGSFLCISPFSMISRVLLKITQECVPLLILIAPVWSAQPWFPELLKLCKGTSAAAPGKINSDKAKKYCPLNDG